MGSNPFNKIWTTNYQDPFDQQMAALPDFSPEEQALTEEYQRMIQEWMNAGGAQAETARGAQDTAMKYYGGYGFGGTPLSSNFQGTQQDELGMTPLEMAAPMSDTLSPEVVDFFKNLQSDQVNKVGDLYGPAAQFDMSSVPQTNPTLLSEGGLSPEIMALMRGHAIDDASNAGITQLAQGKRALGQAGLGNSGASAALASNVARQTGDAQNRALGDIDIANADVALGNQRANFQMANQMAMENASKIFSAMSQNVSNQQQSSMGKSSAQANAAGTFGGMLGNVAADRATRAPFTNNANEQRTNELNFGAGENRWQTSLSALTGMGNPSFPTVGGNGTSVAGSLLSNVGSSFLDQAISKYPWGKSSNTGISDGGWG